MPLRACGVAIQSVILRNATRMQRYPRNGYLRGVPNGVSEDCWTKFRKAMNL